MKITTFLFLFVVLSTKGYSQQLEHSLSVNAAIYNNYFNGEKELFGLSKVSFLPGISYKIGV
ncbi:MAG: hypothetical protein QM642_04010 [Edaphocola sp.]